MRRKIIVLLISIIIPIIGTIMLGVYDYKIWYNPTGDNGATYQTSYKSYVSSKLLEISGEDNYEQQTLDRIELYRGMHSYYYGEKPIYEKDVTISGERILSIMIFKDVVQYTPSSNSETTNRIRYEIYVYNVNYDALAQMYVDNSLPANKNEIADAGGPTLLINFYPNNEYNDDEAIYTSAAGASYTFTLYNGKVIYGSKLNSSASYSLYDYNSTPTYSDDESTPYNVKYLGFNDYTSTVNISDDNDDDDTNDRDRFENGAYIKIDTVLEATTNNYTLKNSLLKDNVDEMNFDLSSLDTNDYLEGFGDSIYDFAFKGVFSYKMWIFSRYVWWQCLIALVVLGGIMAGFYFTFTYEEPSNKKVVKNIKSKK